MYTLNYEHQSIYGARAGIYFIVRDNSNNVKYYISHTFQIYNTQLK